MQATRLRSARLRPSDACGSRCTSLGLVTVGAGHGAAIKYSILQQALLWLPFALLLATLLAKSPGPEVDIGELDAQLLAGELPIDAFLDEGISTSGQERLRLLLGALVACVSLAAFRPAPIPVAADAWTRCLPEDRKVLARWRRTGTTCPGQRGA